MMPQKTVSRLILFVVIVNGLFFAAHLLFIHHSLSDGNHINPNTNVTPWRNNGVAITVTDEEHNQLRDGDIILAIEGQPVAYWLDALFCFGNCPFSARPELREGQSLTYLIEREGEIQTARTRLRPYPFWELLRRSWGALTFPVVSYLIFLTLFFKRPEESSVIALVVAAAGLLGSMGWLFGLSAIDLLNPTQFWVYRLATEGIYWLSVVGVLHFALVFPRRSPLVQRHSWIPLALYPAGILLYGLLLVLYSQSTDNKLLWMASRSTIQAVIVTIFYGLAMLGLVANYRSLTEDRERQQVRIVVFTSGLLLLLSLTLRSLPGMLLGKSFLTSNEIAVLAIIVPVSTVFAIQRHSLWGVDTLVNRTLVFVSVSITIVGLYIVIVSLIGWALQTDLSLPTSMVATGIIAVAFQPIRHWLQHVVNRAMYGKRDDPEAILTELAQQMETAVSADTILPNLVQTIALTLKIPYAAIWLPLSGDQFEPAAVYGNPPAHLVAIPLIYQNKAVGNLMVAPRSVNEAFNQQDKRLLNTIAALSAGTVHAVQLSDKLRHSRRHIITAREEERRRLRRDLHDGLGPQLASQTLGLEAVEQLLDSNPQRAMALLASLKSQAHEAVSDIRRLVYDLRPPALDDLGLVGALRQSATRLETADLRFVFEVPDVLPELPAAVETAVYRITQEAMTNVVRHAQATSCYVRLICSENQLLLEIEDNGQGMPADLTSGVGLQSIQERTAELSGSVMIKTGPTGGSCVQIRLPLEKPDV